jgi:aminoglycoside phosphotransferase family enzyme/predicted kinase
MTEPGASAGTATLPLVERLARSLGAELVETHISWVLLADRFAYKVKKPVRLPFVDYGTLERRRHFCEEEVRLNRRMAPTLYLGVSRITGSVQDPRLDGPGETIEYAVRMRRFPAGALFSEQVAQGTLTPDAVDRFAQLLAQSHAAARRARPGVQLGASQHERALAALAGCGALLAADDAERVRSWIAARSQALQPVWQARHASGRVRDCHGDLHLANVVGLDGGVAAFDCIEFDPALRWIDIADDAAFAWMDFIARGRADLGWRFINGWLERTGDYDALPVLRFALVYRALVRAQVEHLRAAGSAAARRYAGVALAWAGPGTPHLAITHGLPGSGKSFVARQLAERQGAICVRSDVERKRLFGLGPLERPRARRLDIYTADATQRTYARLLDIARTGLQAGCAVVLDAAFLRHEERAQAAALAAQLGVPFSIVACKAPLPLLRRRLLARRDDASDADVAVLEKLRSAAEPLQADERPFLRPWQGSASPAP